MQQVSKSASLLHVSFTDKHNLELAAAATIIKFWGQVMPDPAWSTIFLVIIVCINFLGVKIYGELEYWFAMIKILIVIVFIIIGRLQDITQK